MAKIGQTTYPSMAEEGDGPYYGEVSVKDPEFQSKMADQDRRLKDAGVTVLGTPRIHSSFPSQGKENKAYEGSQSDPPGQYD